MLNALLSTKQLNGTVPVAGETADLRVDQWRTSKKQVRASTLSSSRYGAQQRFEGDGGVRAFPRSLLLLHLLCPRRRDGSVATVPGGRSGCHQRTLVDPRGISGGDQEEGFSIHTRRPVLPWNLGKTARGKPIWPGIPVFLGFWCRNLGYPV